MGAEEKLDELLIDLPVPPVKPDEFSYIITSGKNMRLAGVLPFAEGGRLFTGRAGLEVRADIIKQAARAAVLQAIAIMRKELGSLNKVRHILKLEVYIAADPNFKDHRIVSDAASNLINQIFGAVGKHCQQVVGVPSLPRGAILTISIDADIK